MKLTVLLIPILVSSCLAQQLAPDSLTIATIRPPPPPLDLCFILPHLDVKTVTARLESGELQKVTYSDVGETPAAGRALVDSWTTPLSCKNGPRRIIHSVAGEFHWPPIYRGSCDNLFCKDPPCKARKTVWVSRCVHVFKISHGHWIYAGRQTRRFLDHLSCSCQSCNDIFNQQQCRTTKPCPNSIDKRSFCYWTPFFFPIPTPRVPTIGPPPLPIAKRAAVAQALPEPIDDLIYPLPLPYVWGRCSCCTPVVCRPPQVFMSSRCRCECPRIRCPPGQSLNRVTCQCDCPKGSTKTSSGECIGDCEDISVHSCRFVNCTDNRHFKCKSDGLKCVCPTCDSASTKQCSITKCLDQPMKPKCKLDPYSRTCRCPLCHEQRDKIWCDMTHCGISNNLPCKWNTSYKTCSCPSY